MTVGALMHVKMLARVLVLWFCSLWSVYSFPAIVTHGTRMLPAERFPTPASCHDALSMAEDGYWTETLLQKWYEMTGY